MKIVILIGLLLLVLLEYSLCVVSHRADEEGERMYRAWKEKCNERSNREADK